MEERKSIMMNADSVKLSKSESLSLSSSSSSEAAEKEVGPKSAPVPAPPTSSLPPRSPQATTSTSRQENEIVFSTGNETKIRQVKAFPKMGGDSQQSGNTFATIDRQNQQDMKKPPHIRHRSLSAGKSTNASLDLHGDGRNSDAKNHEDEYFQNKSPQRKPEPAKHKRKVSWGGKLIQIPQAYTDNSMPPLFPERPKDRHIDYDSNGNENEKAARARAASEIVSEIEATMENQGMDVSTIISTKYQNHRREESSASAIDMDDLARMHPIESEATLGVLKEIESKDRGHQEGQLQDDEQNEAVANLFTPTDTRLLENVPEGAEEIFEKDIERNTSHVSSIAGNSTNTYTSETMIGSSTRRNDPPPTRAARGRIDSATQYSIASTLDEATSNTRTSNAGHNRTSTLASFPTIASTVKSPLQQPNRNHDYGRRRHRRQETMEERLFSLNQALDAVDAPISSELSISKRRDRERDKEQQENTSNHHHRVSTSLDLFNQNLARLFQEVDGQIGSGPGNFEEREMIPLTKNHFEASAHPLGTNNSSTSSTSSHEPKPNKVVSEDGSIDELSKSTEQFSRKDQIRNAVNIHGQNETVNTSVKKYQLQGAHSRPGEDIEQGIFRPTTPGVATYDLKSSSTHSGKTKWSRFRQFMNKMGAVHKMKFFFKLRAPSMLRYIKNLFWLVLVAIIVSAIMFYALGNPPIVYGDESEPSLTNQTCRLVLDKNATASNVAWGASYSWWTLYILVRLPITFTIARFWEIVLIHFILLECRWLGSCIGSTFTLLIVQAKGWPAILFFWSICNLFMLYGISPFVNNWGYWQNYIELFNECNDSGTFIASDTNLKVQLIALVVSMVVAIKRLLIGFYQGRKTFLHYSEELSALMTKILLISEISNLSLYLELEDQDDDDLSDSDSSDVGDQLNHPYRGKRSSISGIDNATQMLKRSIDDEEGVGIDESQAGSSLKTYSTYKTNATKNKLLISDRNKEFVTGLLSQSQKRRIERLLGSWEEPENEKILTENVSIGAILQFRKSLSKLDSKFPFSYAFGKADMRDDCIQSAQNLYFRLLEKSQDEDFHFNILGLVALQPDGSLDQEKLKTLIKVFRPDRDGLLSLIDFVKSMDIVYKEMKLLRASVRNSQKIDKSFEKIFNIFFYFIIACTILNVLGYDPIAVFLSLSSVVLAFSFMISQASSKYVEGLLFILYRRPYDIGDLIVIQPVDEPTSWEGSTEWIVRDINLFTTTVIFAYTNEIATLSNGSIANSRVMNGARSLPAIIYVTLRFGVDTGFEKLEIFREALSQYVDKRPREWAKLLRITSNNVQADQGFVEYLIALQHVNNWQQLDSIKVSRSQAKFFCHELSKKLGMRYKSPPLPVDLSIDKPLADAGTSEDTIDDKIVSTTTKISAESEQIKSLIRDHRM